MMNPSNDLLCLSLLHHELYFSIFVMSIVTTFFLKIHRRENRSNQHSLPEHPYYDFTDIKMPFIVIFPQLFTDWQRRRSPQYFQLQYGILWRAASFDFCQQAVSAIDTRRPHRTKSIAAGGLNYRVAFGTDNDESFRPFSVFPFNLLSTIFTVEHTIPFSLLKVPNEPPPDPVASISPQIKSAVQTPYNR